MKCGAYSEECLLKTALFLWWHTVLIFVMFPVKELYFKANELLLLLWHVAYIFFYQIAFILNSGMNEKFCLKMLDRYL